MILGFFTGGALILFALRAGALEAAHPVVTQYLGTTERNWRGFATGTVKASAGFPD